MDQLARSARSTRFSAPMVESLRRAHGPPMRGDPPGPAQDEQGQSVRVKRLMSSLTTPLAPLPQMPCCRSSRPIHADPVEPDHHRPAGSRVGLSSPGCPRARSRRDHRGLGNASSNARRVTVSPTPRWRWGYQAVSSSMNRGGTTSDGMLPIRAIFTAVPKRVEHWQRQQCSLFLRSKWVGEQIRCIAAYGSTIWGTMDPWQQRQKLRLLASP